MDDDADDTGLLGHPYLQIDTNLYQFRNVDFPAPTGLGADTKLNFGVTDNFDLGMKYGFLHARNTNWRVSDQVATVYGTGFYHFKNFTPYVTTGIGYGWERSTMLVDIPEEGPHYTRTVVDVGTGVEIPIVAQT